MSEGSISCYLNNHVVYRVARFTYGVKCTREFEQNDPEHQRRQRNAFVNPSGKVFLPNGYQAILKKVRAGGIDMALPGTDNRSCRERGFHGIASFPGYSCTNAIIKRRPLPPHVRSFATSGTQPILSGWTLNLVRSLTLLTNSDSVSDLKAQRQVQDAVRHQGRRFECPSLPLETIIDPFHPSGERTSVLSSEILGCPFIWDDRDEG